MIKSKLPEEKNIRIINTDDLKPLSLKSNRRLWLITNELVLKVTDDTLDYESAKAIFQMRTAMYNNGISIPEHIEIVKTKYGYGIVMERIQGLSMFELMILGVYMPDEIGTITSSLAHKVHRTSLKKPSGIDYQERFKKWSKGIVNILSEEEGKKLMNLIDSITEKDNIIHGDMHPANILINKGKPFLVDLDLSGYGNPIYDLACLKSRLTLPTKRIKGFFESVPFLSAYISLIWTEILKHYFPNKNENEMKEIDKKITILSQLEHLCFVYHAHEIHKTPGQERDEDLNKALNTLKNSLTKGTQI